MSVISLATDFWDANRARTLATLDEISQLADPQAVLSWRPGPGRAHIAWQLMHIGITEELFATERLVGTVPGYPSLIGRFRGGSTTDIRGGNELGIGRSGLVQSGASFIGDGTLHNLAAATLTLEDGAEVGVEVENDATLVVGASAGTAAVAEYSQTATGVLEIENIHILKVKPFAELGQPLEIANKAFGGRQGCYQALIELESELYRPLTKLA